jgi:hypothetical protein
MTRVTYIYLWFYLHIYIETRMLVHYEKLDFKSQTCTLIYTNNNNNNNNNLGDRIEAHGGDVIQDPSTKLYYWYGEGVKVNAHSTTINCYVASSLAGPWRLLGSMMTAAQVLTGIQKQLQVCVCAHIWLFYLCVFYFY